MNKDEILARSRKENKDRDLYEMETQTKAGNIGSLVATALTTVFFVLQSRYGHGFDFGLYAIILSVSAASFTFRAIRMKRGRDVAVAAIFTLATLILSVIHIHQLITTSTV